MYANLRVMIEGRDPIYAHEVVVKSDGSIEVHEDLNDGGSYLVEGPVHKFTADELAANMTVVADF